MRILERINYFLQFLHLMHEAVDVRLATVQVHLGYEQRSVGILRIGQIERRRHSLVDFLKQFCVSQCQPRFETRNIIANGTEAVQFSFHVSNGFFLDFFSISNFRN